MKVKKSYKELYQNAGQLSGVIPLQGELLKRLQTVLLQSLKEIDDVCRRNGITMYLCGGSLLGAVRHKGFIPWDDDLDMAMTRDDFERFKTIFDAELGEKFTLSCPNHKGNSITRFPKILLKGTKIKTIDSENDEELFVDIFIIDYCPKNGLYRFLKGKYCEFLMGISSAVYTYRHNNDSIMAFYSCDKEALSAYKKRLTIGKLFSYRSLDDWFNRVDKACSYHKKTDLISLPCGRKHYFGEMLDASVFSGKSEMDFGQYMFYVPQGYQAYLENLYGDYMQIPPVDKRETHMIVNIDFGEWEKEAYYE